MKKHILFVIGIQAMLANIDNLQTSTREKVNGTWTGLNWKGTTWEETVPSKHISHGQILSSVYACIKTPELSQCLKIQLGSVKLEGKTINQGGLHN